MDLDLAQLRALSATVTEGTFEAAARALHVTPSAISQRIKALEQSVGRVLLRRTKPVQVTESGEAILRLARNIDLLAADARLALGDGSEDEDEDGDGHYERRAPVSIPLAVNADSLATWMLPALAALTGPTGSGLTGSGSTGSGSTGSGSTGSGSMVFDIQRDDQDHTTALLRSGSVMAAVTSICAPIQGCTSTPLGAMRYRMMCTPAFAAAWFPEGVTPAALARAPVVVFDRKDDLQHAYLRRRAHRALNPPRHYVPASADFVSAVALGLGWGMLPDLQTTGAEERGELVAADPESTVDVALYWQQWQLRSTSLDLVAEAVRAAAARALR
jgi:LysR family transcriptional regulator (chromosome initiation inhibitor)